MRSSCRPGKIFKITVLHCCFRQAIYVWDVFVRLLSTNWLMVTFKLLLKFGLITGNRIRYSLHLIFWSRACHTFCLCSLSHWIRLLDGCTCQWEAGDCLLLANHLHAASQRGRFCNFSLSQICASFGSKKFEEITFRRGWAACGITKKRCKFWCFSRTGF